MISSFFLTIFNGFIKLLLNILPTGSLPNEITASVAYIFGIANAYSFIIPVGTLLAAAGVILLFDGALLLWYFINWIIRKIPGMQ